MNTTLASFNNRIPDTLSIRVTPKAAAKRLKVELQEDDTFLVRAYLTAAPEDGKANKALIKLLSKEFNLPQGSFEITHGLKSRHKIIKVHK